MMPAGIHALAVAIAAACIAIASPSRPQSYPLLPAPEIQEGRAWLDRKAVERERAFQQQQRDQAQDRRELRMERRLDADRRMQQYDRTRPGWPGR